MIWRQSFYTIESKNVIIYLPLPRSDIPTNFAASYSEIALVIDGATP